MCGEEGMAAGDIMLALCGVLQMHFQQGMARVLG